MVQQQSHKGGVFFNTVDTNIQFTVEEARPDGSIPFLDILLMPQADETFTPKIYRKPDHTDVYLQWDSHHNLAARYSVINTLTHRTRTLCSTSQLLTNELQHLERVLMQCKYPRLTINKILQKHHHQEDTTEKKHILSPTKKCNIVIPYAFTFLHLFNLI